MMKQCMGILMVLVWAGTVCSESSEPAESAYMLNTESAADKQARMAWWKEARFGMFVHWGLYSSAEGEWGEKTFIRGAEWIQKRAGIPADEYREIMLPRFKPAPDFASEWARLAKQAGAKYVVFTGKHHEGFSMHDSALTDYDAKSAVGRDLHREIVNAIRREGLRVGVYHSLWDWHHPDAPAGEGAVNVKGLTMEDRDLARYRDYLYGQVNEITDGRYGAVDILWMDYSRNQYQGEAWGAKELVGLVRENQPGILINNRLWVNENKGSDLYEKYWFGDFTTPEQHIPATGIEGIDWETCDTLNVTWGWSKHATTYKTSEQLIHRLVDAVSKGGNYLLNVGPLPDGSIDPEAEKRFAAIGEWMRINNEAVYGSKASPFTRLPWGRATRKVLADGSIRIHLFVFDWPENGELFVPGLETMPVRTVLIGGKVNPKSAARNENGKIIIAGLPKEPVHEAATVIALDFEREPEVSPYRVHASNDGSLVLEPADATVAPGAKFRDHGMFSRSCLEAWKKSGKASYPLQIDAAGRYSVEIVMAGKKPLDGVGFELCIGGRQWPVKLKDTGGLKEWETVSMDAIDLPAGEVTLELRCTAKSGKGDVVFSTITLRPDKVR
jgi:alpha-L-fucosidase